MAERTELFEITPVESPRSSAYSRMVFSGLPSFLPRTASFDCAITPLCVLCPVTMAVIPAAESVTHSESAEVSERAMCGMFWMNSRRGWL